MTSVSVKLNTAAMLTPSVASASTITVNIVNRDLVIFILCQLLLLTTHWMSPDMILDTLILDTLMGP